MTQYSPTELSKKLEPKLGNRSMWWTKHNKGDEWKLNKSCSYLDQELGDEYYSFFHPAYHWSIFLTKEVAVKLWGEKQLDHELGKRLYDNFLGDDYEVMICPRCMKTETECSKDGDCISSWQYHTHQLLDALHEDKFWEYLTDNLDL